MEASFAITTLAGLCAALTIGQGGVGLAADRPSIEISIESRVVGTAPKAAAEPAAKAPVWRHTFGWQRNSPPPEAAWPSSITADVALIHGIGDIAPVRRALAGRGYGLLVARSGGTAGTREGAAGASAAAIAIRLRPGLRLITRRALAIVVQPDGGEAAAVAVRLAIGGKPVWLVAAPLGEICAKAGTRDPCSVGTPPVAALARWLGQRRAEGEAVVVGAASSGTLSADILSRLLLGAAGPVERGGAVGDGGAGGGLVGQGGYARLPGRSPAECADGGQMLATELATLPEGAHVVAAVASTLPWEAKDAPPSCRLAITLSVPAPEPAAPLEPPEPPLAPTSPPR